MPITNVRYNESNRWKEKVFFCFFSTEKIDNTLVQTNVSNNKTETEIIQSKTKNKASLRYYVHVMKHKI